MKRLLTISFFLICLFFIQTGPVFSVERNNNGEVFDLGDVLISEKGGTVNLATTVSVVSSEEIEQMGANNVADVLERIPGIDVQIGGKGQSSLKLRGFNQDDIKVLIDGVPAHESYYGSLDLNQIPVDSIARIDVTKGASSVLYGANTMGGVINIITKKGGKIPVTKATISIGDNSTRNYIIEHGAAIGKINYWLTGSLRSSDGYSLSDSFDPDNNRTGLGTEYNEDGGIRDLSDYTQKTLNAKIGYEPDENSKLYLSFDYHENEKGCYTEGGHYWEFNKWNQWHINLVGEHEFSKLLTMKARFFYVDHDDTLEDVSWDKNHTTSRKWFETSAYEDYSSGWEVHSYLNFGRLSLLKIGVNYLIDNHKQQDFLDANSYDVIKGRKNIGFQEKEEYKATTFTVAVEDEIKATENMTIIVGVSNDVYTPKKAHKQTVPGEISTTNPQIGIVYNTAEGLTLHSSIGNKTRFPQLKELYSTMGGGNPDLKPQKTTAIEVGASKSFGNNMSSTVSIFQNDIKDKISSVNISGDKFNVNMGESKVLGMEVEIGFLAFDQLKTELNYTYLSSKEKADSNNEERDSANTPAHKMNLDLAYQFEFGLWTFLQASYTGDQIEYDDNDVEQDIDSFFLINAKFRQSLKSLVTMDLEVFMEIKNIADVDYEEGSGPMPGRSMLVGITGRF